MTFGFYLRFPKMDFPNPIVEFLTFRSRIIVYLFGIINLVYGSLCGQYRMRDTISLNGRSYDGPSLASSLYTTACQGVMHLCNCWFFM